MKTSLLTTLLLLISSPSFAGKVQCVNRAESTCFGQLEIDTWLTWGTCSYTIGLQFIHAGETFDYLNLDNDNLPKEIKTLHLAGHVFSGHGLSGELILKNNLGEVDSTFLCKVVHDKQED